MATSLRRLARLGQAVRSATRVSRAYFTSNQEASQPLDREPVWTTAEEAVQQIKSGDTVFVQGAAATPIILVEAMVDWGICGKLECVRIVHMHTEGPARYGDKECEGIFRATSLFMAGNVRQAVAEGRVDPVPIFLHEIPLLFKKNLICPDVALVNVSPPDEHGFCSLGTSVDCAKAGVTHAKMVIAQVNCQMPRTFGDSILHSSRIDYAVEVDAPLVDHGHKKISAVEEKIGELIAQNLVDDEATLQMGIGSIPDAVLANLTNHKDLGIHSEMFSDGVVDLVKCGAVTCSKKSTHRGRIVGSFLLGSKKLYEFVDNNPFVAMYEVDWVNSVPVVAQQSKMTAINSCIEIDLTGQICSDSIGTRMFSGFGGQVDFIRGAAEGLDGLGKPIIALPSSTNKGESKIVPTLKVGAGVVTTRAHVHYVVTEHGIAFLFGKSLRQRAYELINISHPDHREALEKAAFDRLKVMPSP